MRRRPVLGRIEPRCRKAWFLKAENRGFQRTVPTALYLVGCGRERAGGARVSRQRAVVLFGGRAS